MIDLTPLEVRQKKDDFRRSFRGYDVELVNDFLDLVADRMEELVGQNLKLTDRAEALDRELTEYRQKERALSEALMTAQRLQEQSRAHAEREGEILIQEARLEAESLRQDAERAMAREEETLRRVRARRAQLVASFRHMLERELSELEIIEETLELKGDEDEQLHLLGTGEGDSTGPAEDESGPAEDESAGALDAPISEEEWETGRADGPAAGPGEVAVDPGPEEAASPEGTVEPPPEDADYGEEEDWLSSLREGLERD